MAVRLTHERDAFTIAGESALPTRMIQVNDVGDAEIMVCISSSFLEPQYASKYSMQCGTLCFEACFIHLQQFNSKRSSPRAAVLRMVALTTIRSALSHTL
jgi:hypothetical protein